MHDDAHGRVEQVHPLVGDEAHARVLGDPRAVLVEVVHDRLRLRRRVDPLRLALRVEAVADPRGHVVVARHVAVDAGREALLVEGDDVAALPELERVAVVKQHLLVLAAVRAEHHGHVGDHRRAGVVHAEHEDLGGVLPSGIGGHGRGRCQGGGRSQQHRAPARENARSQAEQGGSHRGPRGRRAARWGHGQGGRGARRTRC